MKDKQILNHNKFFFIGIGGIGMSGLAKILLKEGKQVSGSDIVQNGITKDLEKLGAKVHLGHDAKNIEDSEVVIISAAIKGNPEVDEAKKKKVPVYRRSELLGALMAEKKGIAIAGTHGKTTTSTMVSMILEKAELDPMIVVGGEVKNTGVNAKHGEGQYFIAEACEYERSFLDLHPYASVITNIEADHLDTYKDLSDIVETFKKFVAQTDKDGFLVVSADDFNISKVIEDYEGEIITFGISDENAIWKARNIAVKERVTSFSVYKREQKIGDFSLKIPGAHNILNALAAIALASRLEIKLGVTKEVLAEFEGVNRRFQIKGNEKGITVIDDYGHHPTEVKATLEGLRSIYPDRSRKVWCIFQPHQYSRTKFLLEDFAHSFTEADTVIIPDIYAVRDTKKDIEEVNSETLVDEINKVENKALYIATFEEITDFLTENVKENDIVITIGAGPVYKVGEMFLKNLHS